MAAIEAEIDRHFESKKSEKNRLKVTFLNTSDDSNSIFSLSCYLRRREFCSNEEKSNSRKFKLKLGLENVNYPGLCHLNRAFGTSPYVRSRAMLPKPFILNSDSNYLRSNSFGSAIHKVGYCKFSTVHTAVLIKLMCYVWPFLLHLWHGECDIFRQISIITSWHSIPGPRTTLKSLTKFLGVILISTLHLALTKGQEKKMNLEVANVEGKRGSTMFDWTIFFTSRA